MTTTKHTPGQWRYDGERLRLDSRAVIRAPDGIAVAAAEDFNRYDRDDEVEANARLIAAAPELLEALESTHALLIEMTGGGWPLALRAIAKARGEEDAS